MTSCFGPEELQLLASIDSIAESIASQASVLPPSEAEAYIEKEVSKTAVMMRKYEARGTPADSIGYAVDRCLRARIQLNLAKMGKARHP